MSTENSVRDYREESSVPPPDPRRAAPAYSSDPAGYALKNAFFPDDPRRKSPALATIMSAMPGLGQIYVGYYQQGFTNILVVAGIITLLANIDNNTGLEALQPLLGVFLAFFWLFNLVDAGRRAVFYNQALAGIERVPVRGEFALPGGSGGMVAGVVMVLFGLIIFSNTMFGVSLEWLERWWPMGLILGGAYLIYSSWRDRQRAQAQ